MDTYFGALPHEDRLAGLYDALKDKALGATGQQPLVMKELIGATDTPAFLHHSPQRPTRPFYQQISRQAKLQRRALKVIGRISLTAREQIAHGHVEPTHAYEALPMCIL